MGAKSSANKNQSLEGLQMLPLLPESYIQLQQQPSILQHPQLPSLRTYIILLNGDDIPNCISSLRFRKKYPEELIQIYYGQLMQSSKQYTKIKVYVENIVLNLQNFINIHFYDMMAIFHKVFKAFKILYQQYGSFAPDPRMIGFNQKAEVKVWSHVKYSKPKPHVSYQMYDEAKMIESLIQIFSNKVDIATIPIDSHRRKFNLNAKTFDEAIQLIESQVQSVEMIPKSIRSISMLMGSGRKLNEFQIISMNSQSYNKSLDNTVKFNYVPSDPNQQNKPRVNFSFAGQSSTKNSTRQATSLPKVNFMSTSQPKHKVNFTNSSSNITYTINQPPATSHPSDSRLTIKINVNNNNPPNVEQSYMQKTKRNTRSQSAVKFTYN